ncbi:MAG: RNA-binding S4 domain-containing protein [Bacteroidales bacterium]|nr:RNA-binding S4 domain-containing protein [Bacteroidales bacterium]
MVADGGKIRFDKWLWAVRIYKTRSIAAAACRKGKVIIDNLPVKPSGNVSLDKIINVKKLPVIFTYRIKKLPLKRLSAKLAKECFDDLTPQEEFNKLKIKELPGFGYRKKGEGRPTKKERRIIDKYNDPL